MADVRHTVTEADLVRHPELAEAGTKVLDVLEFTHEEHEAFLVEPEAAAEVAAPAPEAEAPAPEAEVTAPAADTVAPTAEAPASGVATAPTAPGSPEAAAQ